MVDSFRQWPLLSTRAGPPHRRTEGDTDRGMAVSIGSLPPHDAPLPLRAERVVGVPVDHEWGGSEAVPCLPLPTLVVRHRANQGDPVLAPPGQERVGGDIARIDQLFPRRQLTGVQMRLNGGQHRNIGGRGRGGRHSGDQVGCLVVTGCGDMHLVARPRRLARFAITGFWVRGGAAQQRRWWQISRAAPAHWLALGGRLELLQPYLPQGLDGGDLLQSGGERVRRWCTANGSRPSPFARPGHAWKRCVGGPWR